MIRHLSNQGPLNILTQQSLSPHPLSGVTNTHRSAVIRLILNLHQQLCSNIDTEECLIAHSLLRNWPAGIVTTPSTSHLYPIENVSKSMLLHKPYIPSCTSISSDLRTEQILLLEPYHLLSPSSVCALMDSSKGDEVISQGALCDVKIKCQLQWLEVQTHSGVKKYIDDMSIFAGRNPIVSITVQLCCTMVHHFVCLILTFYRI